MRSGRIPQQGCTAGFAENQGVNPVVVFANNQERSIRPLSKERERDVRTQFMFRAPNGPPNERPAERPARIWRADLARQPYCSQAVILGGGRIPRPVYVFKPARRSVAPLQWPRARQIELLYAPLHGISAHGMAAHAIAARSNHYSPQEYYVFLRICVVKCGLGSHK
jgi:hypothetical protein